MIARTPPAPPATWDRERDACGVGFVADRRGRHSHAVLRCALTAVASMSHRGALAADAKTGDGAGVLTQIPYTLLRRDLRLRTANADLGVGMVFLPRATDAARASWTLVATTLEEHGVPVLGWRLVPTDPTALGDHARRTQPEIAQVVVGRPRGADDEAYERALYRARRAIERRAAAEALDLYLPSLSHATVVYKGLFVSPQLPKFYPDLEHPAFETAIAVFHQRYSTNTFPSWALAQPFRLLAHNGEINTLQGNVTWMAAREALLRSPHWPEGLDDLTPVIQPGGSDSAMLDNVLELLRRGGRSLLHAMLMLVPSAWEGLGDLPELVRAFFEYHACLMEPWDGPAALAFSDGRYAAAALDRNGLRPARYVVTRDGLVVVASEAGVVDVPAERVVEKGRLGPGQVLAVDTHKGVVLHDDEVKMLCAAQRPYGTWVERELIRLGRPAGETPAPPPDLVRRQRVFGYTGEDLRRVLRPMVDEGKDPVFSMGDDTPPAALATRPRGLAAYFRQRFAQVTNPPIDPLRERLVMSLTGYLGPRPNLLEETPAHARLVALPSPVLTAGMVEAIRRDAPFPVTTLATLFDAGGGPGAMRRALDDLVRAACEAVRAGTGVLLLTDRDVTPDRAPIPMLLATSAVHHGLIRAGLRGRTGLLVESGEARDIHHIAALIGYGASGVHAYLALASIAADAADEREARGRVERWREAVEAGLLKIMSKMGISALAAYHGAQVFEAVGLARDLVDTYFPGTPSRVGGVGPDALAAEVLARHAEAYRTSGPIVETGWIRYQRGGEYHAYNPDVVRAIHRIAGIRRADARDDDAAADARGALAALVEGRPATALRDLLEFVPGTPVPLEEVEPASQIVARFVISAMSHGALSLEAHTTLAIAANRIGARSNSGEGGEDPARYVRRPTGDWPNSAIKQIASARFGVTPAYVRSARELEIKMAQGSKPGEGGQLPGHKVSAEIARIRRSQPGITLISPPPHHDIYSIEDLAQLIYDLKVVHPEARVAVKLVAETGVGTIAAGVAKGFADTVQISGADGGTGASPLDSIKHAGVPWEVGLAEAQRVLVASGLRGRVRLRVDGGLKVARDVVIAALLGAEEFGFGTAAVAALGCVMARQCHLNTCPVGIATQREDLRRKFPGTPENVVNYLVGVAEGVRELLAALGARRLDEIVGRADRLRPRPGARLDVGALLDGLPGPDDPRPRRCTVARNARPDEPYDEAHLMPLLPAIEAGRPVELRLPLRNIHRTVGARLAGAIAARAGDAGLPEGSVRLHFTGAAGQSFGAFLVPGLHLHLVGEANDYVGKSMAGGEIVLTPPRPLLAESHRHVIAGNTVLYGATGGRLFAAGRVGERFAVRNSGAVAVVEGCGDHGCEYMTGGTVVVLGEVGRNFGAGMTGGLAYVYDETGTLPLRYNTQLVTIMRPDAGDGDRLRALVTAHQRATGSRRARALLGNWEAHLMRFWKVAPRRAAPDPASPSAAAAQRAEVEPTVVEPATGRAGVERR
ncbi:MAG: glutamate synthase large subunit [Armatimonadota bacterium]|nr:glutamate synthase large subunit [Armatimonadota bacterium]MDR7452986.1 glutamate synthase large subunit [Armatimonadota bacterium]MDR7457544.1 glutamate synthase large subunit [Armatimonadota bacterium]MDR7496185.1 glutamate synthase large subunit [Armatimonadota bacterium]